MIYVPTPEAVVEAMLQVANVTKNDYVVDLGCGDGRIPVTAAKTYGARGLGVDIDPVRIAEANAIYRILSAPGHYMQCPDDYPLLPYYTLSPPTLQPASGRGAVG